MGKPKEGMASSGEQMHYSVGAVIERKRDGKFLFVDRMKPPFGLACPAGHLDEGGESAEEACAREVREEVGLGVKVLELIFEEEAAHNQCSRGVDTHYWRVYRCELDDEDALPTRNLSEVRAVYWLSSDEIREKAREGKLEAIWIFWFRKMGIVNSTWKK